MRIHVELLPRQAASDVVVVVDTLRSCTAAPLAFDRGLASLDFTPSLRTARRAGSELGLLLLGERAGMVPEGFNHSNSPVALQQIELAGKHAALVSENAPQAVEFNAGAQHILLASFHNATAAVTRALELATDSIQLVAAGFRGQEDLDDAITVAYLASQLRRQLPEAEVSGAVALSESLLRSFPDPVEALWNSTAGRYLRRLDHADDIGLAGRIGVSAAVPERTATISLSEGGHLQRFTTVR